jgi:hypothetical protein
MSAASWIRVANGFRLVASAATNIIAKEGSNGAASLTRHGVDLANNARTAAKAANTMFPVKVEIDKSTFDIPKNATPKQDNVDIEVTPIVQSMPKRMSSQTDSAVTDSISKIEERSTSLGTETTRETKAIPEMSTETKEIPIMGTETAKKSKKIPGMRTETTVETKEKPNIQTNLPVLREGQAVPSTRVGRAFGFASLGVGLAAGTMFEAASRLVSLGSKSDSIVANDANADRLAKTLCRMRGAALKLGQMLSIQDETLLPPTLSRALEQVRQGADAMPSRQLRQQLEKELGKEWRSKFETFEDLPFAAASIGQVHRATIIENGETKNVVVKVQYPGVADSIDSDLKNLTMLVKMSGFAPKGLFIEKVIQVGRDELVVECDYKREAQNQERLRNLVHGCPDLARERFRVPSVMPNHSTQGILTTEYCPGGTIDKVAFLDQEERNRIGRNIMRLTVKELFQWRFMQTDPNVSCMLRLYAPSILLSFISNSLILLLLFYSGETSYMMLALAPPILLILDLHANIVNLL